MSTPGGIDAYSEIVSALRAEVAAMKASHTELVKTLRELIETLNRPLTRDSTIELPSGPVHMRVEEH